MHNMQNAGVSTVAYAHGTPSVIHTETLLQCLPKSHIMHNSNLSRKLRLVVNGSAFVHQNIQQVPNFPRANYEYSQTWWGVIGNTLKNIVWPFKIKKPVQNRCGGSSSHLLLPPWQVNWQDSRLPAIGRRGQHKAELPQGTPCGFILGALTTVSCCKSISTWAMWYTRYCTSTRGWYC